MALTYVRGSEDINLILSSFNKKWENINYRHIKPLRAITRPCLM